MNTSLKPRCYWIGALAAVAILGTTNAGAINPQPEPPGGKVSLPVFGMIGIDYRATLRVNVLNASDLLMDSKALVLPEDVAKSAPVSEGGCNLEISFRDADANIIGDPLEVTVLPGRAAQAEFTIPSYMDVIRLDVRPVVKLKKSNRKVCMLISAGAEVIQVDQTASAVFINPGQYILINPQPEPPGFPVPQ